MNNRERMGRHATSRSRVSRSLHEDANRHIGSDLNMWPQIRARINEEQEVTVKAGGSLSARVEHDEPWLSPIRNTHGAGRERNRQVNLTRVLPSALLSLCMVAILITTTLLPSNKALTNNTSLDACDLITQAEVEHLTGTPMEQFKWQPNREELVACAYFGKDEMMNVMVANFRNEQEAQKYLTSIRPDLIGGLETDATLSSIGGYGGRRVDISGDEGFSSSRTPSNRNLNFWDVLVRQHNRYFIVTWMTNTSRPDPTDQLEDLARLVAARLPAW